MKNIIVKGKPELRKRICQCGHCGCQFHYTEDEVYKNKPTCIIKGPIKCVICPWCLEEIRLPFDNSIYYMPPKIDSGVSTDEKTSASSYEEMVDEIG